MPEFSDAQIMGAISAALRANDMQAAAGLIGLLALQNPSEAGLLYDAVMLLAPRPDKEAGNE
jgi:hypothetical protein